MGSCAGEEGVAPPIPPLRPCDQFHLFVSYSSVDAVWTHRLTGRLEAELPGLKVCLHERDFTPGRNVLENMAGCIQQSQKVLLVLSEDFVQSRWCLLEADLSLVGSCLERKPVLPVLLRPCRVPLHLSHLTYLEATDGRFFQKLVQLLCTPSQHLAHPPALRSAPALYSGKALLTLDCINRDSLPSWKVGSFSTLAVPDPLKEVLEDPELYKQAVGILNGVRSPRSCLRYLGCRIILAIVLILLSVVSVFLPLVLGLQELQPARRFLVISANAFFCPFFMILSVNTLCWLRRSSKKTLRELACRVGEANLLLAPHSVLMGCETKNKLYFVYVLLGDCKQTFLGAPDGEAAFQEAILRFASSYACCLAHSHFPHWEEAAGAPGHLEVEKPGNVHHHFQKLLTELKKSTDAYELSVANRLYGEKEFRFLQEYMDNVQKYYLASVESADFISAAEESQKMINSWVESQTNGRIKNLFPQNSLNSSVLVLVNAVYFKGQWQEEFKKENTVEEKFWLNKDTSKPVQMMKQTNHFKFVSLEDVQAKILEIPYTGGELSMMVLLPDEVDGLQEVEDQLTAEKLIEWTSPQNMGNREVDLYLPRFKVEESYNLVPTLQALGMVDAFCDGVANFSGMNGSRDLAVSKVIHKSFVEVTEEGTEATAATGVVITRTSLPFRERFRCDHPFLFLIKHIKTNSILFCGRVSSP